MRHKKSRMAKKNSSYVVMDPGEGTYFWVDEAKDHHYN